MNIIYKDLRISESLIVKEYIERIVKENQAKLTAVTLGYNMGFEKRTSPPNVLRFWEGSGPSMCLNGHPGGGAGDSQRILAEIECSIPNSAVEALSELGFKFAGLYRGVKFYMEEIPRHT